VTPLERAAVSRQRLPLGGHERMFAPESISRALDLRSAVVQPVPVTRRLERDGTGC